MTRPRKLALGLAAAAVAAAAVLLGGILSDPSSGNALAGVPQTIGETAFASGDTASVVRSLQQRVEANPADARAHSLLGLAYQQRARETGDAGYYTRADRILRRALALDPDDLLATSGLGALALARHDFRKALELGRRARALAPSTARPYGIVGDALAELGRYREAFSAFDTMAALRPSVSSYARVAHARELLGRPHDAIEAMKLAVDAAAGRREAMAWARVELGKLYWSIGRLRAAEREYRAALIALPAYVYALDGLARVEAARGRYGRAVALERRAAEAVPLPQFVGALGDLYRLTHRPRLSRRQYALVGAIERLSIANGVKTDLETALFNLDHGIRLAQSLALARRAHSERPSVEADDVLAFALERNGRCREALRYSQRSLRLGTLDAAKFFHRGRIERCLGRPQAARTWFLRALRLNPHFSLVWSPVARGALA